MKRNIEEALGDCLARLDRGESLDSCLRSYEGIFEELRPLLEAAGAVRARAGSVGDYPREAAERGRARMQAERERQAQRRRPLLGWSPFGSLVVGGVAAAALALAVLGLSGTLFDFGGQPSVAQAEGIVASAGTDSVVLTTADGRLVVSIGDKTVVLDSNGGVISGGEIVPGRRARIEFEEEADGITGLKIEVEDDDRDDDESHGAEVEFSGVIRSIDGNTLTLETSFGNAVVRIDAATEVKGTLQVGLAVKIHATLEQSQSYLAREIEAAEVGEDHGDDDVADDDSGPDSSGSAADGSESGGSGSGGSSSDDDETHESGSGSDSDSSHEDDTEDHESD
jgi:hypothetical protein